MALGHQLKRLRTAKGLTQVELAKRAKVTQGYIAQLEAGAKKEPSLTMVRRLAKILNVTLAKLLE